MHRPKVTVTLRLSSDLCKLIEQIAQEEDRSFNKQVERMLRKQTSEK